MDGDLPGLDSDLPGLVDEADVSPDPGPTTDPAPPEKPPTTDPAPLEEPASQWTHDELDDWFENDFGGDKAFGEKIGHPIDFRERGFKYRPDVPIEIRPSVRAYSQQGDLGFIEENSDRAPHHWRTLSHEMKEQFRTGWSAWEKPDEPPDELDPDPVVDELAPLPLFGERLPILEDDPVGDEPANGGSSSPAPGSFKWLMMVAVAALVALSVGAALLLMDNNSEDSEDAAVTTAETSPATTAVTTAETSPATTASTTAEESTSTPPTSSGTLDPLVESPPPGNTYTATKTADLATDAKGGHREIPPVGTSYEATLLVEETCTGDICSYQSTLDLESACCPTESADYLRSIEWGQREPATWEVNESSWTVEMSARYAYAEHQDATCVVLLEDFWELTITDTQVIDNDTTAAMFTGTITRSDSLDLNPRQPSHRSGDLPVRDPTGHRPVERRRCSHHQPRSDTLNLSG